MAPVLSSTIEPITIANNNNETTLNGDIVHLDKLPEDVQELCHASLEVMQIIVIIHL